jgi:16S rRNA A1518/A1519 N6-dimethyltransferase RsmA/KsgA/DIM1 with predicted DNA glycosylase/AP lyase activity
MLEDKNMLVFVEAIFTIEQLSTLLTTNFKPTPKVKSLLTLVAGKYSETKTAVIAATDKCITAFVKSGAISEKVFVDLMVNHIVATHKNPRVK